MQLHSKIEIDPSKSLGQEEVSSLLIQAINGEHGFTCNNQVYLWKSGWIKYPLENLSEDVRCILKNQWTRQKVQYILEAVWHRTHQKPGKPSNRIPFVKGYLDTRSMKFVMDPNYVRDNKILNYQRFEYDPNARCPTFETVLSQMFSEENGDRKKKALLQYFAYCLIPDNYQKALFLCGTGANGKSTLLDVNKFFFYNHAEIELHDLSDQNALLALANASMVYSHEGEFSSKSMSNFKKITEGKPVLVYKKYVDKFLMEIDCKLIIATNESPPFSKSDIALRRRMLVIDMVSDFRGREDFQLLPKLGAETPGIFNLIIKELPHILDGGVFGYNYLDSADMSSQEEVMKEYIRTLIEMCPGQNLRFEVVYNEYEHKCVSLKRAIMGRNKFSGILYREDLGVKPYKGSKNVAMLQITNQ
jgi:P4 family phage/plasmid primase-like protien